MPEKKEKYDWGYPHRYVCDVLEEMRVAHKGRNYSYFGTLIEETQVLVNRMEDALGVNKDVRQTHIKLKELKKEYDELVDEYNDLTEKFPKDKESS